MKTTLREISQHDPCSTGWNSLLAHLGKVEADDEPLPLLKVLESNGVVDTLWCFRAVHGHDLQKLRYGLWCVDKIRLLMPHKQAHNLLNLCEHYLDGKCLPDTLYQARLSVKHINYPTHGDVAVFMLASACLNYSNGGWSLASDVLVCYQWVMKAINGGRTLTERKHLQLAMQLKLRNLLTQNDSSQSPRYGL